MAKKIEMTEGQEEAFSGYQHARAELLAAEGTLLRALGWTPFSVSGSFGVREIRWKRPEAPDYEGNFSQKDAIWHVEKTKS